MKEKRWLLCPFCKSKTRTQVRRDTIMENFPLFCPKCKHESIISIKNGAIIHMDEPDAEAQSQ